MGKPIYNRFLQVHRGYGYYGRAAADGEMVEVPVDEANDIMAKAIEVGRIYLHAMDAWRVCYAIRQQMSVAEHVCISSNLLTSHPHSSGRLVM